MMQIADYWKHVVDVWHRLLETLTRFSGLFVGRVTKSWKIYVTIAVALLGCSVALLLYALQDLEPRVVTADPTEETATSTANRLERALDGMLVDASSTHLLPLGVMVENSSDAWPLQGVAKADLVFEAPVEGSITRFFLVFDASSTVSEIGPVRSARPYFVDWADGLDAQYAHVGGSPDALAKIVSLPSFRDLNEFWNGWVFWRSSRRAAPHNIYTSTDLLLQAAAKQEVTVGSFHAWTFTDPPTSTTPTVTTKRIPVPYDGVYEAEWIYDEASGEYVRHYAPSGRQQQGAVVSDADGTSVRVKNVVLMLTDAQVVDDIGRLRTRTTGRGKAWVFTAGGRREAEWFRTTGEHIRFEGVDGTDIAFYRGKTWISVLTSPTAFDRVSN